MNNLLTYITNAWKELESFEIQKYLDRQILHPLVILKYVAQDNMFWLRL